MVHSYEKFINWHSAYGFYFLLISLVFLILLPPFLYEIPFITIIIYFLVSLVLLSCFLILFDHKKVAGRGFVIFLIALSYLWFELLSGPDHIVFKILSNLILAVFFTLTFIKIIRKILKLDKINTQVVIGAIAAYLLLGLLGAFLFSVINLVYPNSFSNADIFSGFYAEIYLSFITISTLGYGDITPITPQGQAAAIFVSITGQLYLTILMAMLVGKFLKDSDW